MKDELREDFRVGECLVRPRLNRVEVAGGRVVQVQPKIMDVLLRLAARPGEVVTREELLRTVWADTHVTEHVLARAVSELRKVFDDRAQHPRVIETIPKVGYRLIAPVSRAPEKNPESETRTPTTPETHAADASRPTHAPAPTRLEALRHWAGLAALSSAVALMLVIVYLLLSTRHVGPWHFNH